MFVVADSTKMVRQCLGELPGADDGVVFLALLTRADRLFHLLRHVGKDVAFDQGFQRSIDYLGARGCIERQVGRLRRTLSAQDSRN